VTSCSVRHSVVQQVPAQKWRRVSGYSVAVARPEPFDQRSASPPQSGFQAIARQLVPAWAHGLASLCGLPMPLTHSRHTRFGGGSRPDRCIAAYSDRSTRALLLATALKALIALPTARPPERSIRVRMGRLAPGWPWQRWQQQAAAVVQQARPAHAERTGTIGPCGPPPNTRSPFTTGRQGHAANRIAGPAGGCSRAPQST
jgi:hypothetical protein